MLYEHPDVAEAAVIGVPDPTLGEEVGAAVALKPGATITPTSCALREGQVAAYKYPRHVWFVDALPKGPTGKILKREIDPAGRPDAERTDDHDYRSPRPADDLADRAAPLDALLVDAALGPPPVHSRRVDGEARRRPARRPRATGRRLGGLAAEVARAAVGRPTVAPVPA